MNLRWPFQDFLTTVPTQVWQTLLAVATVTATVLVLRQLLRGVKLLAGRVAAAGRPGEDILTIAVACIATGVSAQGMWRFTGDVLGFDGPLRLLLFAFIELAVLASAVRARRNMRENHSAGIDGIAVWVLAALTAVFSALDARSAAEAIFRLAAPLVAAWLWERGMAIERHRISGRSRIKWRFTRERAMVRLGLAELSDRTVTEVDAHRRLTRVALAAKRARALREAGASHRKMRAALHRLDRRLDQAVEHTGLARDEAAQRALLDQVTALYGGTSLLDLPDVAPWTRVDHPAVSRPEVQAEPVAELVEYVPDRPAVPPSREVYDWARERDLFDPPPPGDAPPPPPDGDERPVEEEAEDRTEYVPERVPEELLQKATSRFLPNVVAGDIPGVRTLKDELNIGQPKAQLVRAYLSRLAAL
ncbi:hypothetical protein Ssi03_45980 [Sphaerisporangium siamense]|uniref:DUF2637 domain-containing protein n=1 Tax=Sphaerisporangium siamense TaxID=795645 RepID=A0A7W7D309_9ACTN|nr:hypothetical protein [Sphaerisporangium siamense]MBB4699267.1 hypothetical protein [Sphaerisporangium siamense]GII86608.1 hypothetical protein Ssi03_45980 [Sphaerisporangium siamense]